MKPRGVERVDSGFSLAPRKEAGLFRPPYYKANGEVAEWSIASDSKSDEPARVPGVRIPPSPPLWKTSEERLQSKGLNFLRIEGRVS